MAWETRGNRRYYYRSRRVGTLVKREFLGSGARAREASDAIDRRRAQRAADAQAVRETEQRHEKATALLDLLCRVTDLAVTVELTRQGFRKNCRHWRRPRVANNDQPAGTAHPGAGEGHHREGPPG